MLLVALTMALAAWVGLARPRSRWGAVPPVAASSPPVALDVAVACDLLEAVLRSGASVPDALEALGVAVASPDGQELAVGARMLRFGASWSEAFAEVDRRWDPVLGPLRLAWTDGVAPGPVLRAEARTARASRAASAREQAARLGVRLVLPLGLCLLPAFALMGLVPVVISTGGDLLGLLP